jgi:hypothetical protein
VVAMVLLEVAGFQGQLVLGPATDR